MKSVFLILLQLMPAIAGLASEPWRVEAMAGSGFDLSRPSATPLVVHAACRREVCDRLSLGAGAGLATCEKPLLPVFASLRFDLATRHRLVPFVMCNAGYAAALSGKANGGFCFSPSVGTSFKVCKKSSVLLTVGCDHLRYERLRSYASELVRAEFVEQLRHNVVTFKVGVEF